MKEDLYIIEEDAAKMRALHRASGGSDIELIRKELDVAKRIQALHKVYEPPPRKLRLPSVMGVGAGGAICDTDESC